MSRKLNKRLKKYMKQRSTPKRIMGVKLPKAVRRACDTELGSAIVAQVLVGSAGAALASPAARKLRQDAARFASATATMLGATAQSAASSVVELFQPETDGTENGNASEPRPGKRKERDNRDREKATAPAH